MTSRKINLEGLDFFLSRDNTDCFVLCEGKPYRHWVPLLEDFAFLGEPQFWGVLAEMGNHLASGNRFRVIQDPQGFREDYQRQVEKEAKDLDLAKTCLRDYGLFDVGEIQPAHLTEDGLIFFSQDRVSGVPYRVSCPLKKGALATYALLRPVNLKKETL